jgi:ABC-type sugar transport system permease subunit
MTMIIISIIIFLIIATIGLTMQIIEDIFEQQDYGIAILKSSIVFILISFIVFLMQIL